jgi:hypothetical protein
MLSFFMPSPLALSVAPLDLISLVAHSPTSAPGPSSYRSDILQLIRYAFRLSYTPIP